MAAPMIPSIKPLIEAAYEKKFRKKVDSITRRVISAGNRNPMSTSTKPMIKSGLCFNGIIV